MVGRVHNSYKLDKVIFISKDVKSSFKGFELLNNNFYKKEDLERRPIYFEWNGLQYNKLWVYTDIYMNAIPEPYQI